MPPMMTSPELNLKGFTFQELFTVSGLNRLDEQFLVDLAKYNSELAIWLTRYRQGEILLNAEETAWQLIAAAEYLDSFLINLFSIESAALALSARLQKDEPVFLFKKHYVLREAKRLHTVLEVADFLILDQWLMDEIVKYQLPLEDTEWAVAELGRLYLEAELQSSQTQLILWCAQALLTDIGQRRVQGWVSFKMPAKLDYAALVPLDRVDEPLGRYQGKTADYRHREGFALTDHRMSQREVMNEIHYCVYCHKNSGDYCSKGFPVKRDDPSKGFKQNPVGDALTGCPLEEKISEMQFLKKEAKSLGALAMVMLDNPLCAATGHRICNDCMKSCIYQKQEPVNIPEVETRVLTDVLDLPWGVEIYDLLMRWNPLRATQWVIKPYNHQKVLIMGMGPAGFTLAHHLLMEGFAVVGAEGLKIEPLETALLNQPIYAYQNLQECLSTRVMTGFGGVAEYGITVRWDKNFLKLIYLSLARRQYFQVFGNVRFGGTLTVEDVWELGFDHLALAVGAGLPRELNIPNSLAKGMRQANDFLMALQLTGAAKKSSLANLQIRLPAVVIGGGLTGIDTATEVQAYYLVQIEKIASRYDTLVAHSSIEAVRAHFTALDLLILDEFLAHNAALEKERQSALEEKRAPNWIALLQSFGGVTVVYRRSLQESPAYQRNHEEVTKAMQEGIYYAEGLEPSEVVLDSFGYCKALRCISRVKDENNQWVLSDESPSLPARSIFVATGAKPNVAYSFEHKEDLAREKGQFQYERFDLKAGKLIPNHAVGDVKMPEFGAFTSYERDHHRVTFLGDTHPIFQGSVVKAIASAKRIYPKIAEALKEAPICAKPYDAFKTSMQEAFQSTVKTVTLHHPQLLELCVHAPLAAKRFQVGQFYRLQTYEKDTVFIEDTQLQAESLAQLAFMREEQPECLSFFIALTGVSSRLMAKLKPGQSIALMGPTGVKASLPDTPQTVLIVGGVSALSYALSVGKALKKASHHVVFWVKSSLELAQFCEDSVDEIWMGDEIDPKKWALFDRVDVIGGSALIHEMNTLRNHFKPTTQWIAAVYGPMQCMLKGVCAQCLQWQKDPLTGARTKAVYACSWQHQPMDMMDVGNLEERLSQNHLQEVLSGLWLDYLETKH